MAKTPIYRGGVVRILSLYFLWFAVENIDPGQSETSPHGETLGMHVPEARMSSKLGAVFFLDDSVIL
jgi:uncharacterized RDD family membrane protein YckC